MLKILSIFVFVSLAIGSQTNSFKPNEYLTRIMYKISGETNESRVVPSRYAEFENFIDYKNSILGTFKQKVFVYDSFYKPGGPLFFLISARSDFYSYWLENSIPTKIVQQTGGAIYAIEPRYFGDSRPTQSTSASDLQNYFTLDHIISDYVEIIKVFKQHFLETYSKAKVILYGYDTGATLAAWIYNLHPDMVNGVWASSAPMYPNSEFSTYFSNVQATIQIISPICHDRLETAFRDIKTIIASNEGWQISNYFNIGNVLSTHDINDVNLFYYAVLTGIGSIVEYTNYDVVIDFCTNLENVTSDYGLETLGNYFKEFFNGDLLTYANLVNHFKSDTWDSQNVINGERQQLYQSCSYLSWFRTSTGSSSFFNVDLPMQFYTKLCKDVFNIEVDSIAAGNILTSLTYNLKPDLTNIYFTNGIMDPYWQVGITKQTETRGSIDVIMTVGKAFDFSKIDEKLDYQEVLDVKLKVKNLLESWINIEMVVVLEDNSIPVDNLINYIEKYVGGEIRSNTTFFDQLMPMIFSNTISLENLTNFVTNFENTYDRDSVLGFYKYDVIPDVGKAYDFRPIMHQLDQQQVINIKTNVINLIESWLNN